MRIIRFETREKDMFYGCEYDGRSARILEGDIYGGFQKTGRTHAVEKLLPPIDPRAIICIGLNYKAHAKETGMELPRYPVVFMKNPGAVTAHEQPVVIPQSCMEKPEVDYEAELAVVIGKPAKNVSEDEALEYVLGYTIANDISARRWQKHAGGGQWIKGKSFDTFCPIGPWLVSKDEIEDPNALEIECVLNGQSMQKSNTSDMIFNVKQLISYLSQSATLLPGTIILTGTPSGVGFARKPPVYLESGDLLETKIEQIGVLKNPVMGEA